VCSSDLYDANRNAHPEPLRTALDHIRFGYFNEAAVLAHIQRRTAAFEGAQARLDRREQKGIYQGPAYEQARRALQRARSRYTHDLSCYEAMKAQEVSKSEDIVRYRMAYRVQMSGRVSPIGGGAQSASRPMQAAIYHGLPGVHNYDIRSSQAYVLADLLTEAGLDASWLTTYLNTDRAKATYAQQIGIDVDTWKTCLYALFNGASMPRRIAGSRGAIRQALEAAVQDPDQPADDLDAVYDRFRDVLAGLPAELENWHSFLTDTWANQNGTLGRGGDIYVRNDVGVTLCVGDLPNPYERKKKLAAFLLQGREAAFIHALTARAEDHGFVVISNEHDGLVTIGAIPEAAVDEVRQALDMPYVQLPEKPFC